MKASLSTLVHTLAKCTKLPRSAVFGMATMLALSIPGLAASHYTFTTYDVPGSTRTAVNANSPHAIAGDFDDAQGNTHGFILSGGLLTTVDFPGGINTGVNGISATGQFGGTYVNPNTGLPHAFVLSGGSLITLDPPNSVRSQGGFPNANGEVVGAYRTADQKRHGFLWRAGVFASFNVPGDDPVLGTVALGMNDLDQVVGDYVDAAQGVRHGFLLSHGTYTTLDFPGGTLTVAEGISDAGVIVGLYFDTNGNPHGFVLGPNGYSTVDVPNSIATEIFGINAQGDIVGTYFDVNGTGHGFIGSPVH
jgi:hypothetical protein